MPKKELLNSMSCNEVRPMLDALAERREKVLQRMYVNR